MVIFEIDTVCFILLLVVVANKVGQNWVLIKPSYKRGSTVKVKSYEVCSVYNKNASI